MKIVCISDTHLSTPDLPAGDILIHAGDLTYRGAQHELVKQFDWLSSQYDNFKHVIVIPGNHDFGLESKYAEYKQIAFAQNIQLLNEEQVIIDGIKIYGSPITPFFHNWAFNRYPGEIGKHWDAIPDDTNVLVTHGPPYEVLDRTEHGDTVGCPTLYYRTKQLKDLKFHIFGHIHEDGGKTLQIGNVTYCNASIMNEHYKPVNKPIVIEI